MSDPLDAPPADHGSDRYGYFEVSHPDSVQLSETFELLPWVLAIVDRPCADCNANVFMRWIGPDDGPADERQNWHVTIAHDQTCPMPELG